MTNFLATVDTYPRIMQVLDLISQGGTTPTKACRQVGISWATVRKHIANDPVLQELHMDAEQAGFDAMADALLTIDDPLSPFYSSDPKVMKVLSENIKWYLSRKDAARFGEKITVENKFTADKTIVEALSRGRERAQKRVTQEIVEDVTYTVTEAFNPADFL